MIVQANCHIFFIWAEGNRSDASVKTHIDDFLTCFNLPNMHYIIQTTIISATSSDITSIRAKGYDRYFPPKIHLSTINIVIYLPNADIKTINRCHIDSI